MFLLLLLKLFAVCYLIGAILHVLDVLGLRGPAIMNLHQRSWLWFLLITEALSAIGLWFVKVWGLLAVLALTAAQLTVFLAWGQEHSLHTAVVVLDLASIATYFLFQMRDSLGSGTD